MKSFAIGLSFIIGVSGAFLLGDLSHTDETRPELTKLYTNLFQRKDAEIEKLKLELEEATQAIEKLQSSRSELAISAEAANSKLAWYAHVLSQLTDGRTLEYEIMRDGAGAVVFVKNTPGDDAGRERIVMKLGAAFAGYDTVTFWHDKNLAQNYLRGRLERNEDANSPPYDGMFAEIAAIPGGQTLLLYRDKGEPQPLVFGKFIK